MNWQNCECDFRDNPLMFQKTEGNEFIMDEQDENKALLLKKFKDPSKDEQRQLYLNIVKRFGNLILQGSVQEITTNLMTEDCDIYVFNNKNKDLLYNYFIQKDMKSLPNGVKILKRQVKQTNVDMEKSTVFQVSMCQVYHENDDSVENEATLEVFTFTDKKISKYRICFGCVTIDHGPGDPLEASRKDRMLAKVKELNYALADQPDLVKIATLFHESTEYKIWSWDSMKCFTFKKHDIVEKFKNLEENYSIICIVPYEVYNDSDYVIGTYVYHLEEKSRFSPQKFVWLTTCIYAFDEYANLMKISQQGELFRERDARIPFETFSKGRLAQRAEEIVTSLNPDSDLFYNGKIDFDCNICRFGPHHAPNSGSLNGLKDIHKFPTKFSQHHLDFEWAKAVDVFIDQNDPSYDVAIVHFCAEGKIDRPDFPYAGIRMNFWSIILFYFENGKLAKILHFYSGIPKPVPSPYDNPKFEALNIKRREEIK